MSTAEEYAFSPMIDSEKNQMSNFAHYQNLTFAFFSLSL